MKLLKINENVFGGVKPDRFCALGLDILTVVKRFNLTRPLKPLHIKNVSQSSPADDVLVVEKTKGKIVTVPQIFAIDYPLERPTLDIGYSLQTDEVKQLRQIINDCYLEPVDIEIKPYEYEMNIRLTNDVPFHCNPRRLSYLEKKEVQKTVEELMKDEVIRPSDSPYASAIVLVKKNKGRTRMCVDYRGLNKITVRDNYQLPLIEDCIEYLEGKTLFTVLDLKSGFHQVKVHEDSVKYTAFVTPNGQYEYTRMPFGLKNAPSVFQRFINNIFRYLMEKGLIIIYMDNLLLVTKDFEEH